MAHAQHSRRCSCGNVALAPEWCQPCGPVDNQLNMTRTRVLRGVLGVSKEVWCPVPSGTPVLCQPCPVVSQPQAFNVLTHQSSPAVGPCSGLGLCSGLAGCGGSHLTPGGDSTNDSAISSASLHQALCVAWGLGPTCSSGLHWLSFGRDGPWFKSETLLCRQSAGSPCAGRPCRLGRCFCSLSSGRDRHRRVQDLPLLCRGVLVCKQDAQLTLWP